MSVMDTIVKRAQSFQADQTSFDELLDEQYPIDAAIQPAIRRALLAEYLMSEESGQVVHDTGPNNLNGVLGLSTDSESNDPEWDDCRLGLTFDGVDDCVTLPPGSIIPVPARPTALYPDTNSEVYDTGLTEMSIEEWEYITADASGIAANIANEQIGIQIYDVAGQPGWIAFFKYADPDQSTGVATDSFQSGTIGAHDGINNYAPLNTWTHFAITRNAAEMAMYVNGRLLGTKPLTIPGSHIAFRNRTTDHSGPYGWHLWRQIGGDFGGDNPLTGKLAQVSFYNRALTEAEIMYRFNRTRWRFGL